MPMHDVDGLRAAGAGPERGTSSTSMFAGPAGLAALSGPTTVSAAPHAAFAATRTRVRFGGVVLDALESSAHTSTRTARELADHPMRTVVFLLLLEGSVDVQLEQTRFRLEAGECFLVDGRDSIVCRSSSRTRFLRVAIEQLRESGTPHRPSATVPGPLRHSLLIDGYIAFISSILVTTAEGAAADSVQLVQAVTDLQSAVLAEARRSLLTRTSAVELRQRIELFIQEGCSDPDLTPSTIAEAFVISVRQAHLVFNHEQRTLAAVIRNCRVDAVAQELRARGRAGNRSVKHLAKQHGFRNTSTMSRVFRHRFGTTLAEYRGGPPQR